MAKIYCSFYASSSTYGTAPWYNETQSKSTVGLLFSDMLDDTNTLTGVTLTNPATWPTNSYSASYATADSGTFPEEVMDGHFRTGNGTSNTITLGGLPAGASYTLEIAGHNNSGRDTQFTVEGVAQDYICGATSAPTAPTVFTGTVDPDGEIVIVTEKAASGSFYGYLNGFILEYTAAGLTIDSTDASMQRDTNFEMVVSNPSTAPTTGNTTLTNDTTVLTPSSVTGSDPYTITFPVGDVDKQVDATGYPWTLEITP